MEEKNQELLNKVLMDQLALSNKRILALEESIKKYIPIESGPSEIFVPKELKRNKRKPLLESEIKEAQLVSQSAQQVANHLGVSYLTYKKYAKMYGIHKINKTGVGVKRTRSPHLGKYPLNEVLEGKHPDYPAFKIKDKLIRSGMKEACCEQCAFKERRIVDNKIPLLLVFDDGNPKNHKIENLKIFCYNCAFTSGKLWMKCSKRKKWLNDPERILGSETDVEARF